MRSGVGRRGTRGMEAVEGCAMARTSIVMMKMLLLSVLVTKLRN